MPSRKNATWAMLAGAVLCGLAALAWISRQQDEAGGNAANAERGGARAVEQDLHHPTAAQAKIAQAIAAGHAYDKHVVAERLFPEVKSQADFAELIGKVLAHPTHHRKLENGREAFFDEPSNTIVIYNPHARDRGTCFRPRSGLQYYTGLK
jgi:hypothetical protein